MSRPTYNKSNTTIQTWFERDRAHVWLGTAAGDKTLLEFWDDAVSQAVEDGFLNPEDWHGSALNYWHSLHPHQAA